MEILLLHCWDVGQVYGSTGYHCMSVMADSVGMTWRSQRYISKLIISKLYFTAKIEKKTKNKSSCISLNRFLNVVFTNILAFLFLFDLNGYPSIYSISGQSEKYVRKRSMAIVTFLWYCDNMHITFINSPLSGTIWKSRYE